MLARYRHQCAILTLACFMLSGCAASQYGVQTTNVNYFPQCYTPINQLRQAEHQVEKTVVQSAAIGTLLGAVAGLILSGGDARGAVVGAASGAVGGAAIGYSIAKRNENLSANQRMAGYLQNLEGDIRGIDEVTAASRVAIQCYNKEFVTSLDAYKNKRISRVELDARYGEILAGTKEAERIMGLVITNAATRNEQYQAALTYEKEQEVASQPKSKTVAVASKKPSTKPAKQAAKPATKKPVKQAAKPAAKPEVKQAAKPADKKVEPTIAVIEERTQNYQASREELMNTKNSAAAVQASWAADLAALES